MCIDPHNSDSRYLHEICLVIQSVNLFNLISVEVQLLEVGEIFKAFYLDNKICSEDEGLWISVPKPEGDT